MTCVCVCVVYFSCWCFSHVNVISSDDDDDECGVAHMDWFWSYLKVQRPNWNRRKFMECCTKLTQQSLTYSTQNNLDLVSHINNITDNTRACIQSTLHQNITLMWRVSSPFSVCSISPLVCPVHLSERWLTAHHWFLHNKHTHTINTHTTHIQTRVWALVTDLWIHHL